MRGSTWLWLAALVLFAGGGALIVKARGIRNNNPGNLRRSGDNWQGLRETQSDPEFFQFTAPLWGIRALVRTLHNYQKRYGLNSIAEIIARYAPEVENDTASYVRAIERATGIPGYMPLNLSDPALLAQLAAAIIKHENGVQPYPLALIEQGAGLALV